MKRNKGITLIALIITIIILIILTAVTISNVMNSNLFNLAKGAAENYVQAGKEEEKAIDKMIGIMQGWKVGDNSKIQPGDVVKITDKDNYTDEEGRTATVPAGFKVSTKSSEQLIEDGLVIQDEQGNEFVWIPCYVGERPENAPDDLQKYEKHNYAENNNWKEYEYKKYTDWEDKAAENYGNSSVTRYGGFYIARYEAGIPEEKQPTSDKLEYDSTSNNKNKTDYGKPISKANKFSWNFISQTNAKSVSESMYEKNETEGHANSYLVDGTAWDTITNWIGQDNKEVTTDSSKYGNYISIDMPYSGLYAKHIYAQCIDPDTTSHWLCAKKFSSGNIALKIEQINQPWDENKSQNYADVNEDYRTNHTFLTRYEIPTGSVDNFKLKNIYDLAGNMYEWTTEVGDHKENGENVTSGSSFSVIRGRWLRSLW